MSKILTITLAAFAFFLVLPDRPAFAKGPPDLPTVEKEPSGQSTPQGVRKLIDDGRYADAERAARDLLAETEAQQGLHSVETAKVLDLLVESLWRCGKAREHETLEYAERAVAIKEDTFGTESPEVARSLLQQAHVLMEKRDLAQAQEINERALTVFEKSDGVDALGEALAANSLCEVLVNRGLYEAAKESCRRAVDIRTRLLGPDHVDVGESVGNLGYVYLRSGEVAEASKYLEKAIAIGEDTHPAENPIIASQYTAFGLLKYRTGEYRDALSYTQRALAIYEKTLGPDHPRLGVVHSNLSFMYGTLGYMDEADTAVQRATEIFEKGYGPRSIEVAIILGNSSVGVKESGDYVTARNHNQRALEIFEERLGPDDDRVGWILSNYANLLWEIGDFDEAERMWNRSLNVLEKSLGPQAPILGSVLLDISECYRSSGRLTEARDACERALKIAEKNQGPHGVDVVNSLHQLAKIELSAGNLNSAEALCQRALRGRGPHVSAYYEPLLTLADVKVKGGDFEAARDLYEQAATACLEIVVPTHPDYATAIARLAEAELILGNEKSALANALNAERISRSHLCSTIPSLAEREALQYAAVRASGLAVATSVLATDPQPAAVEAVLDAVIHSRAVVLDEMGVRHRSMAASEDAETLRLAAQLASARRRLAHLTVAGPGAQDPSKWKEFVNEARRDKELAERALLDASLAFRREMARSLVGLDEVSKSLPPDAALVSFVRSENLDFSDGAALRPASYSAFVLLNGKAETVIHLGPASDAEELVRELRASVAQIRIAAGRAEKTSEASYRNIGEALRRRLWDPIAPYLEGTDRIIVVPDGALSLVSFAALPIGDTSYLIEQSPPIWYVSAERDLVVDEPKSPGDGLLALGDPAFDDRRTSAELMTKASRDFFRGPRSSCGSFRSLRFEPLPSSAAEIVDIAGLWSEGNRRQETGVDQRPPNVFSLSGPRAHEAAVKAMAEGRRVLHLATHGFFLGGDCQLTLYKPDSLAPTESNRENPLLHSGLALAGANHRDSAGPDEEDGILTAEEIASLDLSSVEWAVLSACDTGVGEVRAGEGVFGLRRAFQIAGARSLIMSLWPVDDDTTRAWMRELYTNRFVDEMSTIDAVHEASLALLHERREKGRSTHPFYWAGFIASGDWR